MKFDNFRELLLKKSADSTMDNMIRFVKDDVLADMIYESLEKMARAKHKGDAANLPLRDFGTEMDPDQEPGMIHDALSHHASRYKAAVRDNRQDLANNHAKQLFKIIDMADQAQKHSHGKLHISAVPVHPWERNGKTATFTSDSGPVLRGNKKVGQFVTDTKGWRHRGNDFKFLQQAPHDSYSSETDKNGHKGAYPMEQIRVNGKYLHIDDISPDDLKGEESHPLDHHPIMSHFSKPAGSRTQDDDAKYLADRDKYTGGDHIPSYWDKHSKLQEADPDGYSRRGSTASNPIHGDPLPSSKESIVPEASAAVSEKPKSPTQSSGKNESALSEAMARLKAKGIS